MGFYFCGSFINTNADEKEVEHYMYMIIPHFWGSHDRYGYEGLENHLEEFFSYFFPDI